MTAERSPAPPAEAEFPDVTFVDSTDLTIDEFTRFYNEVLEPGFPPSELVSLESALGSYHAQHSIATIAMAGKEAVGGALGDYFAESDVLLLSYLAIRPDMRSKGIGSALLRDALSKWREKVDPVVILAEIEDPRVHGASQGTYGDPVARLKFYARLGSRFLPVPYFQPSLEPGVLPRVRGMLLISPDSAPESVSTDVVLGFLREYMTVSEGAEAAEDDAEFTALCDKVESWAEDVPLWPLARVRDLEFSPDANA